MVPKTKHRRTAKEEEKDVRRFATSGGMISAQFKDLKAALSTVSEAEWAALSDVVDPKGYLASLSLFIGSRRRRPQRAAT